MMIRITILFTSRLICDRDRRFGCIGEFGDVDLPLVKDIEREKVGGARRWSMGELERW